MSYGTCEASLSLSDYNSINAVLAQAASQGQSVVVASGDTGSTDCYGTTSWALSSRQALAVDFPSSSQYVTGIGGTEFPLADVNASKDAQGVPQPTPYFQANGTTDVLDSAISYIPEQAWNDDVSATSPTGSAVQAGGGGRSNMTSRPSWQTKVPGIPSGSDRLVPDVSLSSSAANAPYLYCSSDTSLGITGSCTNGFRDSTSNGYLTVGGGTSFATPIFAGMLALIGEKIGAKGMGVAAATLYSLAANSTTYASAFHDITSGGNNCTSGPAVCGTGSAVKSYAAGTGYDLATGLGSVDFNNLLAAWPSSGSTLKASTTTLTAATTSPASGESDTITISVASASTSSTAIPTGTVSLLVDGSLEAAALPLSNGSATYTFSSTTQGTHSISSAYSGDSTYAASDGALTVVVGEKGFRIASSNTTVASGGSGSTTVTVTPVAGYTGTVAFSFASVPGFSNGCLSISDVVVSDTSSVTGTLSIKTSSTLCNGSALSGGTAASTGRGALGWFLGGGPFPLSGTGPVRGLLAVVSLLFAGAIGLSRPRRRGPLLAAMACAVVLAVSACGGGSSGGSSSNTGKGTYAVTITGKDTTASTIAASTVIIVTVD